MQKTAHPRIAQIALYEAFGVYGLVLPENAQNAIRKVFLMNKIAILKITNLRIFQIAILAYRNL